MTSKTITIEKMINSGLGLARPQNGPITLVRQVLPGEEIIAKRIDHKKQYVLAQPTSIVKKHKERVTPSCPHYSQCGGCDFGHASYTLQLEMKEKILADLFDRAFVNLASSMHIPVEKTLPSPRTKHYRQRIRLQVDSNGQPGFFRLRSHDITTIRKCLLAVEPINTTLAAIIDEPTGRHLLNNCKVLELLLNPETTEVIASMHYKRQLRPMDKKRATQLTSMTPTLESVFFQGQDFPLTGPFHGSTKPTSNKTLSYRLPGSPHLKRPIVLTWEVGGFSQVNLAQNNRLIDHVLSVCNIRKSDRVLDLYCGMGNFSIPLAMECDSLVGADSQRSAIRSAQKNSAAAGLTNCVFRQENISEICQQLRQDDEKYDLVVLDPPRQGVGNLAETITKLATKKIVYISCDPATLCRDLVKMTQSGFIISHIQPVDMFPQTHHIETVVLLEKN